MAGVVLFPVPGVVLLPAEGAVELPLLGVVVFPVVGIVLLPGAVVPSPGVPPIVPPVGWLSVGTVSFPELDVSLPELNVVPFR